MDYKISREEMAEACKLYPDGENKVGAIKYIRSVSGAGLKEAKEFVEAGYPIGAVMAGGPIWHWKSESVAELVGRLFELSAEIAEIHNKLAQMGVEKI